MAQASWAVASALGRDSADIFLGNGPRTMGKGKEPFPIAQEEMMLVVLVVGRWITTGRRIATVGPFGHRHGGIRRGMNGAGVGKGARLVKDMTEGLVPTQEWAVPSDVVILPIGPRGGGMVLAVYLGPVHRCTYGDGKVGKGEVLNGRPGWCLL